MAPKDTKPRAPKWLSLLVGFLPLMTYALLLTFVPSVRRDVTERIPFIATPQFIARSTAVADKGTPPADWILLREDQFGTADLDWVQGDEESEGGIVHRTIDDGVYRWQRERGGEEHTFPVCLEDAGVVTDFYLSVEFWSLNNGSRPGLVFRGNGDRMFVFEYTHSGPYIKVAKRTNFDHWQFPLGWYDATDRPDGQNKLAVLAIGSHFWFFVNDQYISEFNDASIDRGYVGLSVTDNSSDSFNVAFDNFLLYVPTLPESVESISNGNACKPGPPT